MKKLLENKSLFIVILVVTFALGWIVRDSFLNSVEEKIYPVREDSSRYQYINPLIFLDNSENVYEELEPLKDEVREYIDKEVSEKRVERVAFYFRDLNSAKWTGVYPDEKFVPSSTLKVATLMVYLREVEDDSNLMTQKLFYKKNSREKQNYPPSSELKDGYYSVGELMGQMLIESDNAAAQALHDYKLDKYTEFYDVLRLPLPPQELTNYMSPREISRIFRALYSSTYLLHSYSEQALELLTKTKFEKGLTQNIDSNIKIAHKFGEHTVYYKDNTSPDYQLHDCGIVYYPEKPYFICVMTEGKDLKNLESIIGHISSLTYHFVKSN